MGTDRSVRRLVAAVTTVGAIALLAGQAPAAAQAPPDHDGPETEVIEVSGDVERTGWVLPLACDDGSARADVDAAGEWSGLGDSSIHWEHCLEEGDEPGPDGYTRFTITHATYTITTGEGTLSGAMTGWIDSDGSPIGYWPFEFELTIDNGTGRFEDATGTLTLKGGEYLFFTGVSISGTVTIPPPSPETLQDCFRGGWRDVVDDNGDAFRNQGQCVRFVRHL